MAADEVGEDGKIGGALGAAAMAAAMVIRVPTGGVGLVISVGDGAAASGNSGTTEMGATAMRVAAARGTA